MREYKGIFHNIDWCLVILYLLLVFLGWMNIYASAYDENHKSIFDLTQKYGKQMIWILAALLMAMAILLIEGKFFFQFAYLIYTITILFLVLVIFAGREISGSKSWFQLWGIALQPAEFAKMGVVLAVSKYLSGMDMDIRKVKTYVILCLLILVPVTLVLLQHDAGSQEPGSADKG